MPERRRLLLVTVESDPPPYPSLREIFGRLLPAAGWDVDWVLSALRTPGEDQPWAPAGGQVWRVRDARGRLGPALAGAHAGRARQTSHLRRGVRAGRWQAVLVRDDPLLGWLFGRACRAAGVPFLFQVSHLKEEEALENARRGIYGSPLLNRAKGGGALLLRGRAVGAADVVLVISEAMRAHFEGQARRLEVLGEGAPRALAERPLADGPRPPRLLYAGTLSRVRRLEILFPMLVEVRRVVPAAELTIVGPEVQPGDRAHLVAAAAAAGVAAAVEILPAVAHAAVAEIADRCAVGLSPFPPSPVLAMNSPAKLYEYLALGLPVVASQTPPEQAAVLAASGGGLAVAHEPGALSAAVVRLLQDPAEARRMALAGRRWVLAEGTFEVRAQRLVGLLEKLVSRG